MQKLHTIICKKPNVLLQSWRVLELGWLKATESPKGGISVKRQMLAAGVALAATTLNADIIAPDDVVSNEYGDVANP
jgi:hypothetical protein